MTQTLTRRGTLAGMVAGAAAAILAMPADTTMAALPEPAAEPRRLDLWAKGVMFFMDQVGGTYGTLTLWDSREATDVTAAVLGPRVAQMLTDAGLTRQPDVRLVEIYEPRG